jgi:HTH-type transcriptional regulator, transcriptional repressor of NAD biosynthesis genes
MPVHRGHMALIEFAASRCDQLMVSMSFTDRDPIPATLRFSWIQKIYADHPVVTPEKVADDFDDESLPLDERVKLWAAFIRGRYGDIDFIFSSEHYGKPFAQALGAMHIAFDPERHAFPVSATDIRTRPLKFWEFIPQVVRPYFVKKICIYGPESTGKSTLAIKLASYYKTDYVPEVAREFLITNDFSIDDIVRIGEAHDERIKQKLQTANKLLFCDTDVITTQIYAQYYLGTVPGKLYDIEKETTYALYFLLDIDVEWVPDGLRDLGHMRAVMFNEFKQQLEHRNIPFKLIKGDYAEREHLMKREIDRLFF